MPSDSEIEKAFRRGDGDDDDGLSVEEAIEALNELCGKSFDSSDVEEACSGAGISTSSEMSIDEFKELVKYMEDKGNI